MVPYPTSTHIHLPPHQASHRIASHSIVTSKPKPAHILVVCVIFCNTAVSRILLLEEQPFLVLASVSLNKFQRSFVVYVSQGVPQHRRNIFSKECWLRLSYCLPGSVVVTPIFRSFLSFSVKGRHPSFLAKVRVFGYSFLTQLWAETPHWPGERFGSELEKIDTFLRKWRVE